MVIGNGLLATAFGSYVDNPDVVIFASGISNSKSFTTEDCKREFDLLLSTIKNNQEKTIVYFGTCAVYDSTMKETPYVVHKEKMEYVVRNNAPKYHIFRLSNLAGKAMSPERRNQSTILNYLFDHIDEGKHFELWKKAYRNIIDVEDVFKVCDYILKENIFVKTTVNVMNIVNYKVSDIVSLIEEIGGRKGVFTEIDKVGDWEGFHEKNRYNYHFQVGDVFKKLRIDTGANNYLENVLLKYYW